MPCCFLQKLDPNIACLAPATENPPGDPNYTPSLNFIKPQKDQNPKDQTRYLLWT